MDTFEITDPQTGRVVTVEGDKAPTAADIEAIFASLPSDELPSTAPVTSEEAGMNPAAALAMEGVTAFNRAATSMADVVTSPIQALLKVAGVDVPTLRSTVPEMGAFSGGGVATEAVAAGSELATMGLTGGSTTRMLANSLPELAQYGEGVLRRVLRVMGQTTPADDVAMGFVSGVGGEVAANVAGQAGVNEDVARLGGQVISPAAWAATTRSLINTGRTLLQEATPSIGQIKGASRAQYAMLDEAGVRANGPSTEMINNRIDEFIEKFGVASVTGSPTLSTKLNQLKAAAEDGKVTYGFLYDAHSVLKSLANSADTQGTLSKEAADMLDGMIMDMVPDNPEALGGVPVREVINEARGLWRRYSVSSTIQDTVDNAILKTETQDTDFLKTLRTDLGKLLRKNNKAGRYINEEERKLIRDVATGKGGVKKLLEAANAVGFSSNDLIRSIILSGAIGGATFNLTGSQAAAGGAVLVAEGFSRALSSVANRMFSRNASFMQSVVQAGPNAEEIVKAYMRATPRNKRDPRDLTVLFLNNKADINQLRNTRYNEATLVSDAIALGIAGQNLLNNTAEQPAQ